MATDPEDAPGALPFTSGDYQLDEAIKDIAAGSSSPPPKSSDRKGSPAATLPKEIIEYILYFTDPETFASLVLVNRAWRQASEQPQLYAHHLSRCPSYSATHSVITGPFKDDSLLKFKRLLVQEAKRHLFEVFMRPQQTIVNLISTTTSSSAAFPYGEKFEFVFSSRAQYCLAISSSRIIVLDTASQEVSVKRELKVVRRPLSAGILYNGSLLAVLSTPHKVNLYNLAGEKPIFLRSLELDGASHSIALSLHGEVLAAANDNGVEVASLGENAPPTEKRGVKCDRVDNLSFSCDGTMLLGTTQNSKSPSTVILSAPYFTDAADHDMDHAQLISHMWTSQIIFPNSSRDCSHAALLPRINDHDSNWTLTYDRTFESFRAVRTDDLRNGTTYFTGPNRSSERERQRSKSALVPGTLPTITPRGELVAAAFLGAEIWMYGVPEDLDNTGVKYENARPGILGSSSVMGDSPSGSQASNETLPRWQVLVDKFRNVFAKGRRIAHVSGVTNISWHTALPTEEGPQNMKERLVIAAPGGVSGGSELEHEEMSSVDGGRLVCLDFNWSPQSGATKEITIEVGSAEPQLLEEENTDMATEIAIVRRRTVARREGIPRSMVSSVADVLRPAGEEPPPVPPVPTSVGFGLDHTASEAPETNAEASPPSPASSGEGVTLEEAAEALDGPYSHTHPRSRNTLYRSATAVEASRRRAPPAIPASGRVEYRRTDGTELPHESDADNWVPPPPPYTKEAEDHLPHHLRHILMSQSSIIPMTESTSQSVHAPSDALVQSPVSDMESPLSHTRVPSVESTAHSRAPSAGTTSHSRVPSNTSQHTQVSSAASVVHSRVPSTDSTVQNRAPAPITIARRPVPRTNLSSERPLSTITDTSGRRRSVAEASRHSTSGQSWLSRHDSNRSPSPELRHQGSPKPESHRHSTTSASSTPRSRSPSSLHRRPLSSYEPRSSLYRAALQPASSISPIQEPVLPPPARQHASHPSISSTASTRRSTSLTLSGSNLQQRLDYPLPPPPKPSEESPEPSPVSPPTARTNSSGPADRNFSPPPAHPAVRPPISHHPSEAPSHHRPQSQPQPQLQQSAHPPTHAPPRSQPTPEPSAYSLMQQQIHTLPRPPPIPESPEATSPQRRSKRFRSPFRLSTAVKAVGSRPLSRAASALSLRPAESEPRSESRMDGAQQRAPAQHLVSSQTAPVRPQSRAESIRARSKNRLSKRFSRFRGGGEEDGDGVPPVPPMPRDLSGVGTELGQRQSAYASRGRRRGREEQPSEEHGPGVGQGMQIVQEERSGWSGRPDVGAGSGTGHVEPASRARKKEKEGAKCIVM